MSLNRKLSLIFGQNNQGCGPFRWPSAIGAFVKLKLRRLLVLPHLYYFPCTVGVPIILWEIKDL